MIALYIIGAIVLLFIIYQVIELQQFKVTKYTVETGKLIDKHRLVMISDLHGRMYGRDNERIVDAVKKENPEIIFIAGDLITTARSDQYERAYSLLERIVKIAPVYYAYGNHEMRADRNGKVYHKAFVAYMKRVRDLGVVVLLNDTKRVKLGSDELTVYGLNLRQKYYGKFNKKRPLEPKIYNRYMYCVKDSEPVILLAHNPRYTPEYLSWGADLTLCGHYHGGLICLPGGRSVISPSFELFPKYSTGMTRDTDGHVAITSRGLGTHTFNIRVCNRAEILSIDIQ